MNRVTCTIRDGHTKIGFSSMAPGEIDTPHAMGNSIYMAVGMYCFGHQQEIDDVIREIVARRVQSTNGTSEFLRDLLAKVEELERPE